MVSKSFYVRNGLIVGAANIDATTGNINTPGTLVANSATFSNLISVATTGLSSSISVTDRGVNGANIKLVGSGASTPSKSMRVISGNFQIINDAYTAVPLQLDDIGNLTITGGITATNYIGPGNGLFGTAAGLSIGGNAVTVTSVTSAQVTAALGFAPYNSTNPSLYITTSGAPVQSVAGRTGLIVLTVADVSGAAPIANPTFTGSINGVATGLTGTAPGLSIGGNAVTSTLVSYQGSVAANTSGTLPRGLSFAGAYNNGYPAPLGNVLSLGGDGYGQLLLGWSGTTGATADNYIRSLRDTAIGTNNWSTWAKIITDQNFTAYTAPLANPTFTGTAVFDTVQSKIYIETAISQTAATASTAIDLSAGTVFSITIAATTAIVFNNPPASPKVYSFSIITTNNATAGYAVSFPSNCKFSGAILPPRTTTANAIDVWSFFTTNGGATYIASLSVQDAR
jgi:hypothetical protein